MSFEDVWNAIETENLHSSGIGIVRRRIMPEACCDLFLGVEKPSNKRIFLLRIAVGSLPTAKLLPQARGFDVRLLTLSDDPPGFANVLLSQTNDTFRDIFMILTADIASHIASTTDQRTAVDKLLARLKRWQQFLERSGTDGLGEEDQRGLFGELWFIRHYLLPVLGLPSIAAWTGPSLAAQDFQLPGLGVEVKTTTAKAHQKLHITGEKQLESSLPFRIFLFHLSLSAQRDTGETLVDMVVQIRSVLASDPLSLLIYEDGLLDAGYSDVHASRYLNTGYLKREHHFFEVKDEFPRIVGVDLREGVGDVLYSVGVSSCLPYTVRETDLIQILAGLRT